jgi:hypothetical protein
VGRALRTLALALLLGVVVMLLVGLIVSLARPFADDASAVATCRAGYARATTPAESTAVDAERPAISRAGAKAAITCGERRRTGQL